MLVHICCSVDSFYYIKKLKEKYPEKKLVGFFYDPNIHPYSEYYLRMIDAKRSCDILGIEFIEGEYDVDSWFNAVRGLEDEPEKGTRCVVCFDKRVEKSAKKAIELGINEITTTLLMSPKKEFSMLYKVLQNIADKYNLKFTADDFRKNGGTQMQFAMSKEYKAYHQDYCGCIFGLKDQRKHQDRLLAELFSPISNSVLLGSIEEKIGLYEKRIKLEEKGAPYRIIKERFLNYRILCGYIKSGLEVVPSFFFPYSKTTHQKTKVKIEFFYKDMAFLNKDGIVFIDIKKFNEMTNLKIKNTKELIFSNLSFEVLKKTRELIFDSAYNTTPIVVLDEINNEQYEIFLDSKIYEDTREVLVTLG